MKAAPILVASSLAAAALATSPAGAQTACHYDSFAHTRVCNGAMGRQTHGSNPWMKPQPPAPPQHPVVAIYQPPPTAPAPVRPMTPAENAALRAQAPNISGAAARPSKSIDLATLAHPDPYRRTCTRILLFALVNCH